MKGVVEVFQVKDGCWSKTYEDHNLVVHGGKVACADIFTHLPLEKEDGTTPLAESAVQSVSNYTIHSLTLGAGSRTLSKRDSRHAVVYENDIDGAGTKQYLDISGSYYSLLPYRENFNFTQFGKRGLQKTSARKSTAGEYKGPTLRDANLVKHSTIEVSRSNEDGGSLTCTKVRGQDFVEVIVPVTLDLATKYKLSLGVDGKSPVKVELFRRDRISRRNALDVDLRDHVWDFTQADFVDEQSVADKSRLSRTLHASGVIPGELHELFVTTGFDRIDQGSRVELFDYFVKITAPQETDFEKGQVRLHNFKLEALTDYIVTNPDFSKVESLVGNTSFKDLTPYDFRAYPAGQGSPEDLRVMGVYQIGGFEHYSPLYASANALDESTQTSALWGWISVDNVDEYGTNGKPPKVVDGNETNIGVSFNSCSLIFDNSGTATLSKRFKFPKKWTDFYTQTGSRFEQGYLNDPYSNRSLVIKFDCTPVSSVYDTTAAGVKIRCTNLTRDLKYNFVSGDLYESKSWGGSGTEQLLGAGLGMGTTTTLQANIMMPLEFYNDEFKLDIIGHAGNSEGDRGKLTIRNLDIGQLEGWHINEGYASGVVVSSCAGTPVSGVRIITDVGQNPPSDWYNLSSINRNTFLSQTITGVDPKKIYNLIVEGKSNTGNGKVGVALIHKGYSNPYKTNHAKYFTIGKSYNAGNAYQNYFNPDTAVSGFGFTMPGPKGPPSDELSDWDYQEHQKCVKWQLQNTDSPLYKFVETATSSQGIFNQYVNLPNGRYNFSMDLRHLQDTSNPYTYYSPVKVAMKIAATNPSAEVQSFWYNFQTRKWDNVPDSDGFNNKPEYGKTILGGSHADMMDPGRDFHNLAKSTIEIAELKGDAEGWQSASVAFDIRESDFGAAAARQQNYLEGHTLHPDWSTRPVEFWFYVDETVAVPSNTFVKAGVTDGVDPLGTVYIKNAKIDGPPTPREQANTYFVYEGDGTWTATSSLSSVEALNDASGPMSGHRPRRDVSAGASTWNEIGSGFGFTIDLDDDQHVLPVFGMDRFHNEDFPYGNQTLLNDTIASSMYSAEKESVYELMLFHLDGGDVEIHNVAFTDATTAYYDGPSSYERNKLTSEPFIEPIYLANPGGWSLDFKHHYTGTARSTRPVSAVMYVSGGHDTSDYLKLTRVGAVSKANYHTTYSNYVDTVENFGMKGGNRYAFAFDYATKNGTISEGVFLQHGDRILWLSGTGSNTQWVEATPYKDTGDMTAAAFRSLDTFFAANSASRKQLSRDVTTPEFVLPTNVPEDALLGLKVRERPDGSPFVSFKKNFRAYQVIGGVQVSSVMPDFPEEKDFSVQPYTDASTPGELGHFQNMIEFFPSGTDWDYDASTTEHIPTYEKAVSLGAYLPGSGIVFSAGTFGYNGAEASKWNANVSSISGTLNQYSTITPKGHILRHPTATTVLDSSAGLVVSGPCHESTGAVGAWDGRIVKYILTLTKEEVEYLTYYGGGIEAAGLWTVDYANSAKKQHYKYGGPPFLVSGTGVPYSTSLYNLKDNEEPDWRLFAKKVFLAGGLKMNADSEFLTIIWSLKF